MLISKIIRVCILNSFWNKILKVILLYQTIKMCFQTGRERRELGCDGFEHCFRRALQLQNLHSQCFRRVLFVLVSRRTFRLFNSFFKLRQSTEVNQNTGFSSFLFPNLFLSCRFFFPNS